MPERIQKILSSHGIASRREAEMKIREGRVTIDGKPAALGQKAEFGSSEIAVDNIPISAKDDYIYIMLNKPRGYVTTTADERGRKTVMDLITEVSTRLYPVGRLDINSEGLLLLTNDGQFANIMTHPSYNKTKTYIVEVSGDAAAAVPALRSPVKIDSQIVRAAAVKLVASAPGRGTLRISIHEGRNRQIRKMCEMCGLKVLYLKRIAIGSLTLGSLKAGKWRCLTPAEVEELTMCARP